MIANESSMSRTSPFQVKQTANISNLPNALPWALTGVSSTPYDNEHDRVKLLFGSTISVPFFLISLAFSREKSGALLRKKK